MEHEKFINTVRSRIKDHIPIDYDMIDVEVDASSGELYIYVHWKEYEDDEFWRWGGFDMLLTAESLIQFVQNEGKYVPPDYSYESYMQEIRTKEVRNFFEITGKDFQYLTDVANTLTQVQAPNG